MPSQRSVAENWAARPNSLQPRERFRAFFPNALAAPDALVHANRVAVPRVQKGMGETGKRCTVRTATPPIMGEGVVRKFADFNHGCHPSAPPARRGFAMIVAKGVEMRPFAGAC